MVALIKKPSVDCLITLLFSDEQHNTYLLGVGKPFNTVQQLHEKDLPGLRAKFDGAMQKANITNPLNTIFIVGTRVDTGESRILAAFDTNIDGKDDWSCGIHYLAKTFKTPEDLVNKVRTVLDEMGALM